MLNKYILNEWMNFFPQPSLKCCLAFGQGSKKALTPMDPQMGPRRQSIPGRKDMMTKASAWFYWVLAYRIAWKTRSWGEEGKCTGSVLEIQVNKARVFCLLSIQTHLFGPQPSLGGGIEDISVPLVLVGLHGQLQDEVQDLGLSQLVKHIPLVLRVEYTVISNFIC